MAKRKTTRRRSATAPKTRTVYRTRTVTAKRRTHRHNGTEKIPGVVATVALVAANMSYIQNAWRAISNDGKNKDLQTYVTRAVGGFTGSQTWVKNAYGKFISSNALITDAMAVGGGYIAGECVRKYAPNVIKKPLGKIASKVPKVI